MLSDAHEKSVWGRWYDDAHDSLQRGLLQLCALLVLTLGLYFLSTVSCVFVWVIMVAALVLMLFCQMPWLWLVVASSFLVSFYVGCQAGTHWVTVSTHFAVR